MRFGYTFFVLSTISYVNQPQIELSCITYFVKHDTIEKRRYNYSHIIRKKNYEPNIGFDSLLEASKVIELSSCTTSLIDGSKCTVVLVDSIVRILFFKDRLGRFFSIENYNIFF